MANAPVKGGDVRVEIGRLGPGGHSHAQGYRFKRGGWDDVGTRRVVGRMAAFTLARSLGHLEGK